MECPALKVLGCGPDELNSADATPPDRELVRLHPEVVLSDQATIAVLVQVDARAFENSRDPHPDPGQNRGALPPACRCERDPPIRACFLIRL
jgi:hypothetical protein